MVRAAAVRAAVSPFYLMPRREERTLGDLRAELRARLGFVHHGSASTVQDRLLDSWIAEAQETLVWQIDFPVLRREYTETTIAGERLYDLPLDCDIRRTRDIAVAVAGIWRSLEQGIGPVQDSYRDIHHFPTRFDMIAGQLELYPTPDTDYLLRIDYHALPARPTLQTDRVAIDSRLMLLQAITVGKAHYRQPDSEGIAGLLAAQVRALQAGSHTLQSYSRLRPHRRHRENAVRPVMV